MGLTVKQKMIAKSKKTQEEIKVPFAALFPPKQPQKTKKHN